MMESEQRQDRSCPILRVQLAQIIQQGRAEKWMFLHLVQQRLDIRRHAAELSPPTPHGGVLRHAGVALAVHHILYDLGRVVLVGRGESRQPRVQAAALRAAPARHRETETTPAPHFDKTLTMVVQAQVAMAFWADKLILIPAGYEKY